MISFIISKIYQKLNYITYSFTDLYYLCSKHKPYNNGSSHIQEMKNLLYTFFLFTIIIIGLSSCNGDEKSGPGPDPEPPVIDGVTKDHLLGEWEIYYSEKQVTFYKEDGTSQVLNNFRDPQYDGYTNEFFVKNSEYAFENRNVIGDIIDAGTYDVRNDSIFLYVTKHAGRDTSFISTDKIYKLYDDLTVLNVFKFFTGKNYKVKDSRHMRNKKKAPNVHPGVEKIDVEANFNKLLGKWEVYDFAYLVNGTYIQKESLLKKDTMMNNTYTLQYNDLGEKECVIRFRQYLNGDRDTWATQTCPIKIVDDIIYLFETKEDGEEVPKIIDSFFMWVTDWKDRTVENKVYDSFISYYVYRLENFPDQMIETRRYMRKLE